MVLDQDDTSSSSVPATPLDDDDLLMEIVLHLPLQPSSLLRASLVCKRWINILSGPKFLKCYRKHHCNPPLLGFFSGYSESGLNFVPVLDTKPESIPIPAERFAVPESSGGRSRFDFFGCRHGLAVLVCDFIREVAVWDPLTGQHHRVSFPGGFCDYEFNEDGDYMFWHCHAAVLCADTEKEHVHGDCFSSPFKLVLICSGHTEGMIHGGTDTFTCLYESASGVWGDFVSTATTGLVVPTMSSILTGNAVYWLVHGGDVLVFDIERQILGMIKKPTGSHWMNGRSFQLLRTVGGSGLGLALMSKLGIQLWERKSNWDGVVEWVLLQKIIQLEQLFPQVLPREVFPVGYDKDSNAIVLNTRIGDFMLEVESMRFRTISTSRNRHNMVHHPYRNFFTAGRGVGWKWAKLEL